MILKIILLAQSTPPMDSAYGQMSGWALAISVLGWFMAYYVPKERERWEKKDSEALALREAEQKRLIQSIDTIHVQHAKELELLIDVMNRYDKDRAEDRESRHLEAEKFQEALAETTTENRNTVESFFIRLEQLVRNNLCQYNKKEEPK